MIKKFLSQSSGKPYRTLILGMLGLLLLSWRFRLDAMFGFSGLSQNVFIPFVSFGTGVAIQFFLFPNPTLATRTSWLRFRALVVVIGFLSLWGLHDAFVRHEPSFVRAVVVSWQRSEDCGCAKFVESTRVEDPCLAAPTDDVVCIECLGGSTNLDAIERCWGKRRIAAVRTLLGLGYLLFAGGYGTAVGLLLLPVPRPRVFVSYRTADSAGLVEGPVADTLQQAFGKGNVFVADRSIEVGARWQRKIRHYGEICDAFVIVIGPRWLAELEAKTEGDDIDWVKVEVEMAIRKGTLVPFVFGGAPEPQEKDLPAELAALARTQACVLAENAAVVGERVEVLDQHAFEAAMEKVIGAIEKAWQLQRT